MRTFAAPRRCAAAGHHDLHPGLIAFLFGTYAVELVRREGVLSYDPLRLSLAGLFALLGNAPCCAWGQVLQ